MSPILRRILILGCLGCCLLAVGCASKKGDEDSVQRPILNPRRSARLLERIETGQAAVDERQYRDAKKIFKQIEQEYADLTEFDLGVFTSAELYLAKDKRSKAAKRYRDLVDDFPQSELVDPSNLRLFEIGEYYLGGPVIANFIFFKIRGQSRGIKILEELTEDVGLSEPNGLGVRSTVMIAKNLESRNKVQDAYLKWLELATAWDDGPLGKMALLGMSRTKLAAYDLPPEKRRVYYNLANLTNARQYYERFAIEFPEDANDLGVVEKIHDIDEMIATHQLSIAQFYQRTGKTRAANLYYDMIVENWPESAAAQTAREMLDVKRTVVQ
ncbi:tetratricopeptide repeat protein [Planctomycetota bacterium]